MQKHLFSDTDTDGAVTELSWVRESARKPRPAVTKYTRKPRAASRQASRRHHSSLTVLTLLVDAVTLKLLLLLSLQTSPQVYRRPVRKL